MSSRPSVQKQQHSASRILGENMTILQNMDLIGPKRKEAHQAAQPPDAKRLREKQKERFDATLTPEEKRLRKSQYRFIWAIYQDNLDGVIKAIQNGVDPNKTRPFHSSDFDDGYEQRDLLYPPHWTPLMYAINASYPRTRMAKCLIENGADVNSQNQYGTTALMEAARKGNTEFAKFFIENGAKVKIQNNSGQTALLKAAYNGHHDMCAMLIEKGADVNHQDEEGKTALMKAAENGHNGHTDTVEILVQKGALVNIESNDGWTALMYEAAHAALLNKETSTLNFLMKHGACFTEKHRIAFDTHIEEIRAYPNKRYWEPRVRRLLTIKETLEEGLHEKTHVANRL